LGGNTILAQVSDERHKTHRLWCRTAFSSELVKGLLVQEREFWFKRPCTKIHSKRAILVQAALHQKWG
jgi:hypothetical protein